MKKRSLILALCLLLALPLTAVAEEEMPLSVAFVDLQRVQEEWIEVQEFMLSMQTLIREKEAEIQPKLTEYERQLMELQEQLSQPISAERRAEIERQQREIYERAVRERDSAVSSLEAREAQGLGRLYERIFTAINQIGKDGKYDMILDLSAVLYIREAYDLTEQVVELLNATAGQ